MLQEQYKDILKMAWPIILANASVPILGLVGTAVIGQTGTAIHLGAIALAALIFNFVYWGFGFLRMGTTGFVAQAKGAQQQDELRSEEHTSELQSRGHLVCRLLLEKKN